MFTRGTSWNYRSPFGRKRVPEYTYSGSDNSLMYIYFCSPLAELLVKFIPGWLAPNVITLLGLALSLAGYFLVHFHTPKFNEPCSSWVWFVLAFCTFAYQTLDNIDGKQARRTNTSSALGLFVDHGVDALNIVLSSQNVMALLQLGSRETAWACLAVWSATSTPFFFATWEEHFTGSLYLGPFNGPTDGVLIVCISYVITGLADDPTHLWNAGFGLGMSRAEAMISFYGMCVLFTVFGNIYSQRTSAQELSAFSSTLELNIGYLPCNVFGGTILSPSFNWILYHPPTLNGSENILLVSGFLFLDARVPWLKKY